MAANFAILLTIATFVTGVFWFLEKFKWKPARQRKVEAVRKQTDGKIDGKILAEVGKPKGWVDNLASFFPVLVFVFILRSFIFEPFQIPSGSMMPTLLVGDFILVQKFSYGIKDPVTNTTIIPTGKPQRGDVAVFKHPQVKNMDLIKRVVGLPGDKIVYQSDSKELLIYPACTTGDLKCVGQQSTPLNLHYTPIEKSNWVELISPAAANFYTQPQYKALDFTAQNAGRAFDLNTRKETLGNESHELLLLPFPTYKPVDFYKQIGQPAGQWIVPEGHYFMMGDNRDNSDDSRFWGFVSEKNFVGKAVSIWVSFEKQPDEWPTGIRFSRIGGIN